MGLFEGRRSYHKVLNQIKENEKINFNSPIGLLKCRRQLDKPGQLEQPNTEVYRNIIFGELEAYRVLLGNHISLFP